MGVNSNNECREEKEYGKCNYNKEVKKRIWK